jgi:hypothetical protein
MFHKPDLCQGTISKALSLSKGAISRRKAGVSTPAQPIHKILEINPRGEAALRFQRRNLGRIS